MATNDGMEGSVLLSHSQCAMPDGCEALTQGSKEGRTQKIAELKNRYRYRYRRFNE